MRKQLLRHPLYVGFGMLLIGFAGLAEYRGWTLAGVQEMKNVPRSVRDNPGAYRAHYSSTPRYFGGK